MHAVIDHQPPMATQDRRGAAADLETLPSRHRAGKGMVRHELAEAVSADARGQPAIGDPDRLPMEIHGTACRLPDFLLRARAREQRPVHERDRGLAEGVLNPGREQARVLVVHAIERDAIERPESLPAPCAARSADHPRPRARYVVRRATAPCRSSHTAARARHRISAGPRSRRRSPTIRSRLLAAARSPMRSTPLRIAGTVEQHTRDADARIVAASHQTREQIELPVWPSHRRRVEDALDLMGIARLRLHDHADPLHREVRHGPSWL